MLYRFANLLSLPFVTIYIFNTLAYIHHYLDQALPTNLSLHVAGLYQFVSMVMHIKYIK